MRDIVGVISCVGHVWGRSIPRQKKKYENLMQSRKINLQTTYFTLLLIINVIKHIADSVTVEWHSEL